VLLLNSSKNQQQLQLRDWKLIMAYRKDNKYLLIHPNSSILLESFNIFKISFSLNCYIFIIINSLIIMMLIINRF